MASELMERKLYGGEIHLIHNPDARGSSPRYKIMDGETIIAKPKGVTTILGKTLSKDLMQWAVDSAMEYLKGKLPVVTGEDLKTASTEYMRLRDKGGSTGTEAHALVEAYLKELSIPANPSKEASNAYNAFKEWFEKVTPEVLNVEEVIYSRTFQYAGTYDCMLKVDDKVYLCDLKTTNASKSAPNGVYAEHFIQLGAYAAAHKEQSEVDTDLPEIEGLMVISAKKNGKLDIVTNEDIGLTLSDCSDMFKKVVNIHTFMNYTTDKLNGKG